MTDKNNPLGIRKFDSVKALREDPGLQDVLLAEAFASGDSKVVAHALDVVTRAHGVAAVAEKAGITRQALHRIGKSPANPTLKSLLGVLSTLGYQLTVTRSPSRDSNHV